MCNARSRRFNSQAHMNFHSLFVVLLLQLLSSKQSGTYAERALKVIGGAQAPMRRFPYMCSIRRRGSRAHICGGTLIKPQWVVTAAICVESPHGETNPILYCGIYERNERNSSKVFSADRMYVHPKWNGNVTEGHDIALIKLDRTSDSPLPDLAIQGSIHPRGSMFAALGWGSTSSGRHADLLQIADRLSFISSRICNVQEFWDGQIIDSMICAGTGEQDTARGDSGGPLLQLDYIDRDYTLGEATFDLLVGITSFGVNSRDTFKPAVYTRIAYFRDWIDCVIEEKATCSSGSKGAMKSASDPETSSSAPGITTPDERDTHDSRSAEPSFISPELLPEPSFVSPDSLPKRSEENTQSVEALLDFCLDIKPQRIVNQTLALESAREAIEEDDSETVGELLCAGLSPNTRFSVSESNTSWTLLHEAARYNAIQSARILINSGADVNKKNTLKYAPLHYAAWFGSLQVAEVLIDNGANVDARNDIGKTPLHYASAYNQLDVVKFLIENGASKKKKDDYEHTPFDEICTFSSCNPKQISRLQRLLRN